MNRKQAAAAFLAATPHATLALLEYGHGYAKARRESTCRLTRTRINMGEAIRKIRILTRHGQECEVYVANRTFGTLFNSSSTRIDYKADGSSYIYRDQPLEYCAWARWTGTEQVEAIVRSADSRTEIEIVDKHGETKTHHLTNGRWNNRQTPNAFLATLRRSKSIRLVRASAMRPNAKFPQFMDRVWLELGA